MRNSVSTDEELAVKELYFVLSHSKFPSTHVKRLLLHSQSYPSPLSQFIKRQSSDLWDELQVNINYNFFQV